MSCSSCHSLVTAVVALADAFTDWGLYDAQKKESEEICEAEGRSVSFEVDTALNAMFVFAIIGTVLCLVEKMNMFLDLCKITIIDPVTLAIVIFTLEEIPLAVLRWLLQENLRDKLKGNWALAASILALVSPFMKPLGIMCRREDKNTCCKMESRGGAVTTMFLLASIVLLFNALDWAHKEVSLAQCEPDLND